MKTNIKNNYSLLPIMFLAFSFFVFSFPFIFSQASSISTLSDEAKDAIDDKESEIKKLEKQAKEVKELIGIKKEQEKTIGNQLILINANINKLELEIELNEKKKEDLDEKIDELKETIEEKEKVIENQRKLISEMLRAYAVYNNNLTDVFSSDSELVKFINKQDYLSLLEEKISNSIIEVSTLKKSLKSEHEDLKQKQEELVNLNYKLEEKNSYLAGSKKQKEILAYQTTAEKKSYENQLSDIEEKRKEIEDYIEMIEEGKIDLVNLNNLPPIKSGYFTYPVNPVKITQGYGKTNYSNHYASGKHNGIDFGINYGNIYAVKSGKVIAKGDNGKYAYGKWLVIDHGDGLVTLYGHLSSYKVSKGDKVSEGEKIAVSGNTGNSTGPHLHFSVFAKNTFELIDYMGTTLPAGGSINPNRYF